MTPEQWSRVRTYEPHGSFDNPGYDDEAPPMPTPYQLALKRKLWSALVWGSAGVLFVVLILVVTADRP